MKIKSILITLLLITLLLILFYFKSNFKSSINKIAVIIHVGNISVFKEIVNDYPKFFNGSYDLYISCNNQSDYNTIKLMFPKATLFLFENKGMDIGPFLKTIKSIKGDYDYYIKIHTKSDKKWRDSLIKPIYDYNFKTSSNEVEMYGSKKQVKKGMVPTCNYDYLNDIIGRNYNYIFDCNQDMYFIGGTIFAFNRVYFNELKKIKDIDYEWDILETGYITNSINSPTKTHAWEYLFGYLIYLNNKNITLL